MIRALRREALPRTILTVLPVLIFFPQAILHTGVILFLISLAFSGDYRQKIERIAAHPLLYPILAIFAVTTLVALLQEERSARFWSAFAHYQIYVFLLFFISVGDGWQQRAARFFLFGGVLAASFFYLRHFGFLPDIKLFGNYHRYSGNNSILMGIMLALVSGLFLFQGMQQMRWQSMGWRLALFVYVGMAVLFFAQTRTGSLVFFLLCAFTFVWLLRHSWRRALVLLLCTGAIAAFAWQSSPTLQTRMLYTVQAAQLALSAPSPGQKDIRIELYEVAAEMIDEKPLLGHGVGQWRPLNAERAESVGAKEMATPHNDYLLYAVEIGLLGLAAFLWTWAAQLRLGVRLGGQRGAWLLIMTLALLVTGAFNAVLRDLVFGMPFMILLAIPLAGLVRGRLPASPPDRVAWPEALGR